MTAALAYVFPSLYEGFGLPPLEAMACGTPVVSSMAGALRETIGDAAIAIDPTDDDMMIAALERVIEDESTRRDLVARGYERVKLFTWQRTAEMTWAVYERVLGRSCAGNPP
jgi:glycosyltransferase involved in cell wall biosynthesis